MSKRGRKRKFPGNYLLPNVPESEPEMDVDLAGLNEPLEQRDGHQQEAVIGEFHANDLDHHGAQENHGVSDVEGENPDIPDLLQEEDSSVLGEGNNYVFHLGDNHDDVLNEGDSHDDVLHGQLRADNPGMDEDHDIPPSDEHGDASDTDGTLKLNLLFFSKSLFFQKKKKKKHFFEPFLRREKDIKGRQEIFSH